MESGTGETAQGRTQNVVHTLPQNMQSVPKFLTGPLRRIDPATGSTQLLVLTRDSQTAVALSEAVLTMTGPAGIELFPVTTARRAARLMEGRSVLAVAGPAEEIRDLVRGSRLKLDTARTVVLAWADDILAESREIDEALELVMSEIPRDAQRIVVTSAPSAKVDEFAERYLRRAARIGDFIPEGGFEPVAMRYVLVAAHSRASALQRLLDDLDPPSAVVVVPSPDSEAEVRRMLRALGYPEDGPVRLSSGEVPPNTHAVIFYLPPGTTQELKPAAEAKPVVTVTLAQPGELAALRRVSRGALTPFALSVGGRSSRRRETELREELTTLLDDGVPMRELTALEPLLERFDGLEIAAAMMRLLERERERGRAAQRDLARQAADAPRGAPERRPGGRSERPVQRGERDRGQRDRGERDRGQRERGERDRGERGREGNRGGREGHRDRDARRERR